MSRITRFLCYFFGLKFASVLFFTLFPSLISINEDEENAAEKINFEDKIL